MDHYVHKETLCDNHGIKLELILVKNSTPYKEVPRSSNPNQCEEYQTLSLEY